MINDFHGPHFFLSNFFPRSFSYNSRFGTHVARTGEHAYQAEKAESLEEFEAILECATPGQAKRAGRKVTMRPDWEEVKFEIMWNVLWCKFQAHADLRTWLLSTNGPLIEGNTWHDNIWGVCSCLVCADAGIVGQNWLGEQLMLLRETIREIS